MAQAHSEEDTKMVKGKFGPPGPPNKPGPPTGNTTNISEDPEAQGVPQMGQPGGTENDPSQTNPNATTGNTDDTGGKAAGKNSGFSFPPGSAGSLNKNHTSNIDSPLQKHSDKIPGGFKESAKEMVEKEMQQMMEVELKWAELQAVKLGEVQPQNYKTCGGYIGKEVFYGFPPRAFLGKSVPGLGMQEAWAELMTQKTDPNSDVIRESLGKIWTPFAPLDAVEEEVANLEDRIVYAQHPKGKLAELITSANGGEIFNYSFPKEVIEGGIPYGDATQVAYFVPQKNNLDGAKNFSFIDKTGRLVNKETIVLWTTKDPSQIDRTQLGLDAFRNFEFKPMVEKIFADQAAGWRARKKEDHFFLYTKPYETGDPTAPALDNHLHVDQKSNYNFYLKGFEEAIQPENVPESILPSLLVTGIEETMPSTEDILVQGQFGNLVNYNHDLVSDTHDFVTMGGLVEDVFIDVLDKDESKKAYSNVSNSKTELDKGQYFVKWTDALKLRSGQSKREELSNKYATQIVLQGGNYFMNDFVTRKTQFPMNNTLSIACPQSPANLASPCPDGAFTKLVDLLDFYDLRYPVFKTISQVANGVQPPIDDSTIGNFVETSRFDMYNFTAKQRVAGSQGEFFQQPFVTYPAINFYSSYVPSGVPARAGEIFSHDWIDMFAQKGSSLFGSTEGLIASPTNSDITFGYSFTKDNFSQTSVNRVARVTKVKEALNDMLAEKTRSYKDILEGKVACTEYVGFRVEKIGITTNAAGEEVESVLQNYLLPYPKEKVLEFVDTQVKYNKGYKYKIYAYLAIFGTEYEYHFPQAAAVPFEGLEEEGQLEYWSDKISHEPSPDEYEDEEIENAEFEGLSEAYGSKEFSPGAIGAKVMGAMNNLAGAQSNAMDVSNNIDKLENTQNQQAPPLPMSAKGLAQIKQPVRMNQGSENVYALFLDVISRPSLKIVEIPYYDTPVLRVMDRPPIAPNVEIIPYRGKNNNYLVNLEQGMGKQLSVPQPIFPEDGILFFNQYEAQYPSLTTGPGSVYLAGALATLSGQQTPPDANFVDVVRNILTEKPIEYSNDDPPASYQIFRLDTPPASYLDFANGDYLEIEANGVTSVSFRPAEMGKVVPNKKYYYTFRALDIHGQISNPTQVYEVQIVDDSGAVYLDVRTYDFPKASRRYKKRLKRFLSVAPVMEQTVWTPKANSDGEVERYQSKDVKIGREEGSLFDNDKRYKVRVTSKKTGRKIDFNLKFITSSKITPEEIEAFWKQPLSGVEAAKQAVDDAAQSAQDAMAGIQNIISNAAASLGIPPLGGGSGNGGGGSAGGNY